MPSIELTLGRRAGGPRIDRRRRWVWHFWGRRHSALAVPPNADVPGGEPHETDTRDRLGHRVPPGPVANSELRRANEATIRLLQRDHCGAMWKAYHRHGRLDQSRSVGHEPTTGKGHSCCDSAQRAPIPTTAATGRARSKLQTPHTRCRGTIPEFRHGRPPQLCPAVCLHAAPNMRVARSLGRSTGTGVEQTLSRR